MRVRLRYKIKAIMKNKEDRNKEIMKIDSNIDEMKRSCKIAIVVIDNIREDMRGEIKVMMKINDKIKVEK